MKNKISKPLSDDEIEELDDFLLSDMTPESCMDISILDGFLTGVVLTPIQIPPSEWLNWVWDSEEGEESPNFNTSTESSKAVDYIFRHYNHVVTLLKDGDFEPIFFGLHDDFSDASLWCEGFMLCVTKFKDNWKEILKEKPDLFEPIVLLGTEAGQDILDESGNGDDIHYLKSINDRIFDVVPELYKHIKNKGGKNVYQMIH